MLPLFSILFLFFGQSLASHSANQYVDTLFRTSLQKIIQDAKLEPAHLPDYTFEYKDKNFFTTVGGKAEYNEGKLVGLSKVQRFSECVGPKNVSGITFINCTLTFNNLTTSYTGKVKYGVLPKVTIHAKGDILRNTTLNVSIAYSLSERIPQVKLFTFKSIGWMNTTFTGLGPLNNHMKVLEEDYKGRVVAEVVNVINDQFRYAFDLAVSTVPMPLR